MDVSKMLKPEELPFSVSKQLADDINALHEGSCSPRVVSEENDMRVRKYYVLGGWIINDGRFD